VSISPVQIDKSYSVVKHLGENWNHHIIVRETGTTDNVETIETPVPSKRVKITAKGQKRQQRSS